MEVNPSCSSFPSLSTSTRSSADSLVAYREASFASDPISHSTPAALSISLARLFICAPRLPRPATKLCTPPCFASVSPCFTIPSHLTTCTLHSMHDRNVLSPTYVHSAPRSSHLLHLLSASIPFPKTSRNFLLSASILASSAALLASSAALLAASSFARAFSSSSLRFSSCSLIFSFISSCLFDSSSFSVTSLSLPLRLSCKAYPFLCQPFILLVRSTPPCLFKLMRPPDQ